MKTAFTLLLTVATFSYGMMVVRYPLFPFRLDHEFSVIIDVVWSR